MSRPCEARYSLSHFIKVTIEKPDMIKSLSAEMNSAPKLIAADHFRYYTLFIRRLADYNTHQM